MKENKVENLIWIIFAIIGAILVVIGFILFGSVFNYNNKIETTGIITEIWSSRDSDNNRNHKVYVSYVAEGNEYESTLNGYSSSFYEGKEIEIYYDKDNPNKRIIPAKAFATPVISPGAFCSRTFFSFTFFDLSFFVTKI